MAEAEAEAKFDNPMVDPEDPPAKPPTTAGAKEYVPPARRERAAPSMSWQEHQQALLTKVTDLYKAIDKDGDGKVTKHEVALRMQEDDEIQELMYLAGKSSRDIVTQLDADGDGIISPEEFTGMLTQSGFSYSIEWLEEQIHFHQEDIKSRRLNVLSIESGVDASTLEEDAEKCNAEWNEEYGKYQRDLGEVFPVWALMFSVVEDDDGNITNLITHEAVEVIQKMWELDLAVDIRRTIDLAEIIVLVGIPYVIMQREAEEMQLPLRMATTRGMLEYSVEFHDRFADYDRHPMDENGRIFKSDLDADGKPMPPPWSSHKHARRPEDHEAYLMEDNFIHKSYATVFTSTHQQQAVMHRIKSNGMDLDFRTRLLPLDKMLAKLKKAVEKQQPVRAYTLKEILTAAGGFRENCDQVMGDKVDLLAEQVLADPFMTLFHPDLCKTEEDGGTKKEQSAYDQMQVANAHMKAHRYPPGAEGSQLAYNFQRWPDGLPEIQYEHLTPFIEELESFCGEAQEEYTDKAGQLVPAKAAGPGAGEQFIGSLQLFFPVHNREELAFLRSRWVRATHLLLCCTFGSVVNSTLRFACRGRGTRSGKGAWGWGTCLQGSSGGSK